MSQKANYFKIGLFVIVAAVLILVAVVLFGSGIFAPEKQYFETYFDGSVSGLNVGAPVENRGVRIGQVEKITFAIAEYGDDLPIGSEDFYNYQDHVVVIASVDKTNIQGLTREEREVILKRFIARGLRLQLSSNILTGLAYLEADYFDPNRHPVIEVPWEPKNIYIPSTPGAFSTLKNSVDNILLRLEKIDTEQIGGLIEQLLAAVVQAVDDANIPQISSGVETLVASAKHAVEDANVSALSEEMINLLAGARQTNQDLKKLLAREKTDPQMANVARMIAQLNQTLHRIDKLIVSQTPQIEQAMENLRQVSANLSELTENLKKHPSELIFSQPPPESEVPK
ncbi:MAG: MlaD family protein [Planctomycetota bacterium]|jgi:phospholipid/cholesterol/gamma-HCH transport system substrate-binding protein/paraquat-inducible protein B